MVVSGIALFMPGFFVLRKWFAGSCKGWTEPLVVRFSPMCLWVIGHPETRHHEGSLPLAGALSGLGMQTSATSPHCLCYCVGNS